MELLRTVLAYAGFLVLTCIGAFVLGFGVVWIVAKIAGL